MTRLLATALVVSTSAIQAQDGAAILNALVRKGILTEQEAAEIRAEATTAKQQPPPTQTPAPPPAVEVRTKPVTRLQLSGRVQVQYDALDTSIPGATDPASTSHFFARRAYLTAAANLGEDWSSVVTWDFAGSFFDAFLLEYKGLGDTRLTAGIRKVNFGHEERTSSGSLKAIERSGPTRYFVESNNGRRLGAGSYRTGVFVDGGDPNGVFWGLAVTNPERTSAPSTLGDATNNRLAFWANAGLRTKTQAGAYTIGVGLGHLPDQGGKTLGAGDDLTVFSLYGDATLGNFSVLTEYLGSRNENGAAPGLDADSWGFYVQPSYKFSKNLEGVVRYSFLDSDGRGVNLSDGVRSAPSGGTMDKLQEFYLGGPYYVFGNDLKVQAGYVYGRSKDLVSGAPASARTHGARTQVQVNF
jgi:hypothetical protein